MSPSQLVAGKEKVINLFLAVAMFLLGQQAFLSMVGMDPAAAATLQAALVPIMGWMTGDTKKPLPTFPKPQE